MNALVKGLAATFVLVALIFATVAFPAGRKFVTYVLWLSVLVSVGINSKRIASLLGPAATFGIGEKKNTGTGTGGELPL